jgi:hypothetical protein
MGLRPRNQAIEINRVRPATQRLPPCTVPSRARTQPASPSSGAERAGGVGHTANGVPIGEPGSGPGSPEQPIDGRTVRGKLGKENTMNQTDWEKSVLCIVGAFSAALVTVVTVYAWF